MSSFTLTQAIELEENLRIVTQAIENGTITPDMVITVTIAPQCECEAGLTDGGICPVCLLPGIEEHD